MIKEADDDGSGTIDFEEFLKLMSRRLNEIDLREEIVEAFKVFDRDKNGEISCDEMRSILRKLGDKTTMEEIEEIMRDIDPDSKKVFKYEDYVDKNWKNWKKYQGDNLNNGRLFFSRRNFWQRIC